MSRPRLQIAVLGGHGGWHSGRLQDALTARGHTCLPAAVTRLVARIGAGVAVASGDVALESCDAVIVRGIPRGALDQIVFRVDALHVLQAGGVRVVNDGACIERTIDKFLTSALLVQAGLPSPRTIACERSGDALAAFDELGGDVIVKPLFGAMGAGLARVQDRDIAQRVFGALALERAVYYLQEPVAHDGRDVRGLVVGGRVVAAIEREADGWRTNLARGGRAHALDLDERRARLCVAAAAAVGADYAGVDLVRDGNGRDHVLEVNGIPGWQGLEKATGVDVAAALVAHVETLVS